MWLFLCPLFGFFFAWWLMGEPVTVYTIAGTILVIAGLYAGQRSKLAGDQRVAGSSPQEFRLFK